MWVLKGAARRIFGKFLPPDDRTPQDTRVLTKVSLEVMIFLFEIFMVLALTNGAYLFFTNGSGGYTLRPWTSYAFYDVVLFGLYVLMLFKFAQGCIMYLHESYSPDLQKLEGKRGYRDKRWSPLIDSVLLVLQAGTLYVLSFTFAHIDQAHFEFFVLIWTFFGFDVIWCWLILRFNSERRVLKTFILLNLGALGLSLLGAILLVIFQRLDVLQILLLGVLLTRHVVDYILSYTTLYPGAFPRGARKSPRSPAPTAHPAALLRVGVGEGPLTARALSTILAALTELHTKCWLIQQARFADLMDYTHTPLPQMAQEANLLVTRLSSPSPGALFLAVGQALGEALGKTIDASAQAPEHRADQGLFEQACSLVDLLQPGINPEIKAMTAHTLVPHLLIMGETTGLELTWFSGPDVVKEADSSQEQPAPTRQLPAEQC